MVEARSMPMVDTKSETSIWRPTLGFAAFGPLVGYIPVALFLVATEFPLRYASDVELLAAQLPLLLVGAYIVGTPAAFVVGAMRHVMREKGIGSLWILAVNVLLGSTISALTICVLDICFFARPHERVWLIVGALGGVAAWICSVFVPPRMQWSSTAACSQIPD